MKQLKLKHITPYLTNQLRVAEVDKGKGISDEFTMDVAKFAGGNVGGSDAPLGSFELGRSFSLEQIKPVLRPLTSITNVEAANILTMIHKRHVDLESVVVMKRRDGGLDMYYKAPNCRTLCVVMGMDGVHLDVRPYEIRKNSDTVPRGVSMGLYEYLFKNHFDVFGLIEKGLVIAK